MFSAVVGKWAVSLQGSRFKCRPSSNSFHISISMGQLWCKSKLSPSQETYKPQHNPILFSIVEVVVLHVAFRCHFPSEKSVCQSRCSWKQYQNLSGGKVNGTVRLILEVFQVKTISVIVLGTGSQNVFYSFSSQT